MKFLLIKIPERNEEFRLFNSSKKFLSVYPPLGLEYIAATLEINGHYVEIIDLDAENPSKEKFKNLLLNFDAVGISVFINNYNIASDVVKEIKKIDPQIPIIIGGPHCTFVKKNIFSYIPSADISVESEGESVILDLVKYFEGNTKLSDIEGINYKENGKILSGKPLKVIKNLDNLPFPARHLTEKYQYGKFDWGLRPKKRFTTMISSRGCPYKCRFCTRFGNIKGWTYRRRSVDNIIEEIKLISEKYNSIMIVDDNFLADKKATNSIMDKIIELELNLELYILGARVDTAEYNLYKKMKKAGVKYVGFGIESGNQDVLDFYNKNITLKQTRKAINLSREMDFITQGFFIFGAPIETKKYIENTIQFALSLPFDIVVFQPLIYEIGSDIWDEAVKNNIISKEEISVVTDSNRGLGKLTKQEIDMLINNGYKRFYLNKMYISRLLYRTILNRDTKHLKTISRLALSSQMKKVL
jgi:magnesium-protoporphyrin IX monomethyl ester (oxidative) cyclase